MTMLLKHSYSHMTDIYFELCETRNFVTEYLRPQFVRRSKHSHPDCKEQSVIAVKGDNFLCFLDKIRIHTL
jgi:hypothetical protein